MALVALAAVAISGCGGKPFNVKPRVDSPHAPLSSKAQTGGLTVEAEGVTDEDYLYETFDANLVLAGVLAVRVRLTNGSQEPVDLRKSRFEVRAPTGNRYKSIEARRAYKLVVSYYEITTYSKDGYKQSQADFSSHALDTKARLGAGESRQGILFFPVPDQVIREDGFTLVGERLDAARQKKQSAVELRLN
jgi:hypothetical protein